VTAEALLVELERRGVVLHAEGGRLRYSGPPGAVTEDLRRLAAGCRGELLALVRRRSCPRCGRPWDGRGRCWRCCDRPCAACGGPTGSAFIETCLACQAAGLADGAPRGWLADEPEDAGHS
jgi:hypothetical protein